MAVQPCSGLCAIFLQSYSSWVGDIRSRPVFLTLIGRITVEGALRAGPDANPPLNMHRALVFNGSIVMISCGCVFFLRGKQTRKQVDQEKQQQSISLQTLPTQP